MRAHWMCLGLLLSWACTDNSDTDTDTDKDEGDADSDSDSDTDTDTDTDTDIEPLCPELALGTVPGTEFGSTLGFGDDYAEACGGAGFEDITVEVAIPADGHYVFTVESFDFEPAITLFDTCDGVAIGCGGSIVEATLPAGPVLAVIDGAAGVDGGFALTVFEGDTTLPEARCDDGYDNDLDGTSDCEDLDCGAEPQCLPACADLGVVGVPVAYAGSTVGAGDEESCGAWGLGAPEEKISWVAPYDGTFVFSLVASFDSSMSLWPDGCGGFGYCDDVPGGTGESFAAVVSAGGLVIIDVDGFTTGEEGDYTLHIDEATATEADCTDLVDNDADFSTDCADSDCDAVCPEDCANGLDDDNDGKVDCQDSVCAAAVECEVTCPQEEIVDVLVGDTTAQPNGYDPSCTLPGASDTSVEFTAPTAGSYRFHLTRDGTGYDSALAILDGCGGTELACHDEYVASDPNGGEQVVVELLAGQTVIAVVDGWSPSAYGAFELTIDLVLPEAACADTIDEDFDGFVDCSDADCVGDAACPGLIEVSWSNVITSSPFCFTFSSPDLIGQTAAWTDDGVTATLDFPMPSWDASFTGTWSGSDLVMTSVNLFPYGGGDWQTTETLTSTLSGTTLSGTYLYTECDYTFDPTSCPADGGCEVTADFSIEIP
jgi:hypothetical protein